jgi:hypothetical protein
MAEAAYVLGTITSLACAVLLLRSYVERRTSFLLWSGVCFVGLASNNVLLLIDLYAIPSVSLLVVRSALALASLLMLLFALIWNMR